MQKIPLSEYVAQHGQTGTAIKLGITQAAIRKALLSDRNIFIFLKDGELIGAVEERQFPAPKATGVKNHE